jgi:uncharacterized membrane protein YfcA
MPLDCRDFHNGVADDAVTSTTIHWWPLLAALVASGAAGGLLAGLLGVGGGIVIVPALDLALTQAGVDPSVALHVAVATSMATIVLTSVSSARTHARHGFVDREVIRRWAPWIVAGSLGGALAASRIDARVLAAAFGVMALVVALKMLLPLDRVLLRPELPRGAAGAAIPTSIGAISAMVGIGGGTLTVPTLTLCGAPVHTAVGTAAQLGLWISVPATLGYLVADTAGVATPPWTVGYVSLPGVALVGAIAWFIAPYGARLAHSLERRRLSAAFGVFLCAVAARMLYRTLA